MFHVFIEKWIKLQRNSHSIVPWDIYMHLVLNLLNFHAVIWLYSQKAFLIYLYQNLNGVLNDTECQKC